MSDTNSIIVLPEKENLPLSMDRGAAPEAVFLEIGFGNGEFLAALAKKGPTASFGERRCRGPALSEP